jgi:hypothetical protein
MNIVMITIAIVDEHHALIMMIILKVRYDVNYGRLLMAILP